MLDVVHVGNRFVDLAHIARNIWSEHYGKLIGMDQVNYMLDKYQSPKAIEEQIKEGYDYFFLKYGNSDAGYMGIKPEYDNNKLFLSKIYIDKDFRRRGIAKNAVDYAIKYAKDRNLNSIYLTVNKGNTGSIDAYKAFGFETVDSVVTPIGNGYVMDDFIMEKLV